MPKSGKSNKNQTAQARKAANATAAQQPLRRPHICNECGGKITTVKDLHIAVSVTPRVKPNGQVGMKSTKVSLCTSCSK